MYVSYLFLHSTILSLPFSVKVFEEVLWSESAAQENYYVEQRIFQESRRTGENEVGEWVNILHPSRPATPMSSTSSDHSFSKFSVSNLSTCTGKDNPPVIPSLSRSASTSQVCFGSKKKSSKYFQAASTNNFLSDPLYSGCSGLIYQQPSPIFWPKPGGYQLSASASTSSFLAGRERSLSRISIESAYSKGPRSPPLWLRSLYIDVHDLYLYILYMIEQKAKANAPVYGPEGYMQAINNLW